MKAKKSGMNCERKGGDLEKYCEIFKNEMWFIRKKEREKKSWQELLNHDKVGISVYWLRKTQNRIQCSRMSILRCHQLWIIYQKPNT